MHEWLYPNFLKSIPPPFRDQSLWLGSPIININFTDRNPTITRHFATCFKDTLNYASVKNSLEFCEKLEIWYVSTNPYVVSEKIPCSIRVTSILLLPAFFFVKIVPLLKAIPWELCWRSFSSVFSFCKIKRCF